jgi:hypothetical protein
MIDKRRIVSAFLNNLRRSRRHSRNDRNNRGPCRRPGVQTSRNHRCERIERPRMRMVVIVVRLGMHARRMTLRTRVNEVRVNLAGTGMDMLKRSKKEGQQNCQARLYRHRPTHQKNSTRSLPGGEKPFDSTQTAMAHL